MPHAKKTQGGMSTIGEGLAANHPVIIQSSARAVNLRLTYVAIDIIRNLRLNIGVERTQRWFWMVSVITASHKPPSQGAVVCEEQYQWLPHQFALTLRLGTKLVARFCFPGLQLDAPPTRLTTPFPMPDWRRFPAGTDIATIEALPQGDRVRRLSMFRGGVCYFLDYEVRHFIDLRDTFASYLKKLAKKPRSNLIRAERRFVEYCNSDTNFREYRTPQEVNIFTNLANSISLVAHKPRAHGLIDTPETREFLQAHAEKGLVRGYILFHADHPVSYVLCISQCENIRFHKIGYDSKYRRQSPGAVILYYLLIRLFSENKFEYLDFECLEADFKKRFATFSVPCWRVAICRLKPTLLAAIVLHLLWEKSLSISVGLSHRSGITRLIKYFMANWRRGDSAAVFRHRDGRQD
jgi:Acetyltransferase (GNAT) domain